MDHDTPIKRIAGERLEDLSPFFDELNVTPLGNGDAELSIRLTDPAGEAFMRAYQRRQIELIDAEFAALRAHPGRPVRKATVINAEVVLSLLNEVRVAQGARP